MFKRLMSMRSLSETPKLEACCLTHRLELQRKLSGGSALLPRLVQLSRQPGSLGGQLPLLLLH